MRERDRGKGISLRGNDGFFKADPHTARGGYGSRQPTGPATPQDCDPSCGFLGLEVALPDDVLERERDYPKTIKNRKSHQKTRNHNYRVLRIVKVAATKTGQTETRHTQPPYNTGVNEED